MEQTSSSVAPNQQIKTRLFAIALLLFVTLGIEGGLLNIAWTYMKDSFGVENSELGVLLLFATGGSLVAAFGSGAFIGRFGLGTVIAAGMGMVILGLTGIVLSQSWLFLLLIISVSYMGRGTVDAAMNNFVSENFGSAEMNWLHASWGVGLTIAPAIMTYVIVTRETSWRAGYGVMIGATSILLMVVLIYLRQWDISGGDTTSADSRPIRRQRASMRESIRQPMVIWSVLLFFTYGGVEIGTGQLANTLLVEGRNLDQETASLWIGLYWGSFTVGRMLTGLLAFRVTDRHILWISMATFLTGAVFLAFRNPEWMGLLGLIALGIGQAAIFPVLISQTPRRVGLNHSANTIGFQVGITGFGGAVLPGLFALSTDYFGLEALAVGILLNTILVVVIYIWLVRNYPVADNF